MKTPEGDKQFLVRVGASNRVAEGPTLAALRLSKRKRRGLNALEDSVLEWVAHTARTARMPAGNATVVRFARLHNLSEVRARRVFVKLEGLGLLLGHGGGRSRVYTVP